jgi:tetratricopeptide (TPR) repeat protein
VPRTKLANPFAWAALAGALLLGGRAAAQTDTIETQDGKNVTGKILNEAYDHVEVQIKAGTKRKLEWSEVVSIEYGSSEYTEAVGKLAAASPEDALAALEKLRADSKLRPVLKQQVLFRIASLHARRGDPSAAVAAWQELLKAFPGGRYLEQAAQGVVDASIAKGGGAEASKALDALVAEAKASNPGPRFDTAVTLIKARLLEAQGNAGGARAAYEAAEKAGGLAPDQAAVTSLGIGRCQQQAGDVAGAEARFRKLTSSADSPRMVQAGAWNGIGDLLLEQGRKKRDADVLTLALYAYLRGVVLYLPLDGDPTTEHQRALAGAALSCESIAQVDARVKQIYSQQAAELRERLKKQYPNAAN